MDSEPPLGRAAAGVLLLFTALLLLRGFTRGPEPLPRAPGPPGTVCFAVEGATARPGLHCLDRPPTAADVAPLPPCADPTTARDLERLLAGCPVAGRILHLAPDRPRGSCRPRLASLPGAARLALGLPLELPTASRADLEAIPGVGPRTAALLWAHRNDPGILHRLEELPGLGPAAAARLRRVLRPGAPLPLECR